MLSGEYFPLKGGLFKFLLETGEHYLNNFKNKFILCDKIDVIYI